MLFEKQILRIYRRNLFVRNDNADGIFYFSPEDFPGLQAHPYTFRARAGHELKGYLLLQTHQVISSLFLKRFINLIRHFCRRGTFFLGISKDSQMVKSGLFNKGH